LPFRTTAVAPANAKIKGQISEPMIQIFTINVQTLRIIRSIALPLVGRLTLPLPIERQFCLFVLCDFAESLVLGVLVILLKDKLFSDFCNFFQNNLDLRFRSTF